MAALPYTNYYMTAGDSRTIELVVTRDGVAFPIGGYTVTFTLQDGGARGALRLTKTSADDINLTDPNNGLCTVLLDPADTLTLPSGRYYHQSRLSSASEGYVIQRGYLYIGTKGG